MIFLTYKFSLCLKKNCLKFEVKLKILIPQVDIEGTSSQEEATPPPSGSNGSQGDPKNGSTDLESQLRHILNQTDATSPPPVVQGSTDMTDKKLKEILGN